jgi:hypothetical protein
MDNDLPKVPENDRDFKKFMQLRVSHERQVKKSTLRRWLKMWPSQATYLA